MLEKDRQRGIRKRLKVRGIKSINYDPGTTGERGTADIVGCFRGVMFLIEVKQPGEQPTPLQVQRAKEWLRAGAAVALLYSASEVDLFLSGLLTHRLLRRKPFQKKGE